MENILNRTLKRPVKMESQNIMLQISAEKFTPEEYASTIEWLVKSKIVAVDHENLSKEIGFYEKRKEGTRDIMQVYNMQVCLFFVYFSFF